jgi:hypothetical protein
MCHVCVYKLHTEIPPSSPLILIFSNITNFYWSCVWQVVGIIPLLFCLLIGFAALGLGSCCMDISIVVLVLMGLDFFRIDTLTFTVIISKILAHKIQPLEQQIPFKRIEDTILRARLLSPNNSDYNYNSSSCR